MRLKRLSRGWWCRAGVALAALAQASSAGAQADPPETPPAPGEPSEQSEAEVPPEDEAGRSGEPEADTPEDADEEIVVVAEASERTSIDRTTYIVRDNAQARASSTLDLLGRIPTVEVAPDGRLRLLGRPGVRILVDGSEVANPTEFLRNLQGSQVARIEVITNPSAQLSARGTGGVINIVTRRTFASGFGGSLTASAGSFGAYEFKASPTWSRGGLSVAGSFGISRSASRSESGIDRRQLAPGTAPSATSERANGRNRSRAPSGNVRITYQLSPRDSLNISGFLVETVGESSRQSEVLTTADGGAAFTQIFNGRIESGRRDFSADYRHEGRRQGETLTLSARRSTSEFQSESLTAADLGAADRRRFRLEMDSSVRITSAKVDYVRPFAGVRRLSLGAAFQRTSSDLVSREAGQPPLSEETIESSSNVRGSWIESAAYATYQLPLLGGTAMPGLRVEHRRHRIEDESGILRPGGTNWFPSLHLERRLADWLVGNLSYSRRISWPEIASYSSTFRFLDSSSAFEGNPFLEPEITDSYEAKLQVQFSRQTADLTLYSRRTGNIQSLRSELVDGVLVHRAVNLGARTLRGASLVVRGPLGGGFNYSITGNLADQTIGQGEIDFDFEAAGTQYGGSAQLDYRDGTEGRRGADHVMLRINYSGPSDFGLIRSSSFYSASLTWSHAFTDRLSGVLTVNDLFGPRTFRSTYLSEVVVAEQFSRNRGPQITFALTYSLAPPSR